MNIFPQIRKQQSGYSLVELLVVLFVIIIILGTGVLSYRDFSRRQQVISAARQITADLRLAQSEALAGRKPGNCNDPDRVLNAYVMQRVSSTVYSVDAVCGNPLEIITVRRQTLPVNTTIDNFSPVSFKPIGDGTFIPSGSSITITVRAIGTTFTQSVVINSSGDIL